MFPLWNEIPDWILRKFIVNVYKNLVIRSDGSRVVGSPSPLILDQVQGSEVFLALSIWQKCPVWDTKTSIKFLAAQEISKTLHYSRLYYRHKIKSPLIRSENFLNFIQNGLIKERKKPKRLQVQRKHELSKVVLEGESNQKHNGASKERWCGSWTSVKFYVCARVSYIASILSMRVKNTLQWKSTISQVI